MREPRMAPAAGRVGSKLRGTAPAFDGAADGGVPLLVQPSHTVMPICAWLRLVREKRTRLACVAPRHVDVLLERRVAELGEPEPVLLDEIDREAIPPGRNRRAQRDRLSQGLARLHDALERGTDTVPH